MSTFCTSQHHRYAGLLLSFFFIASCDQPKKSDAGIQNIDTLSVKKLTTDSNSDMPIAKPKDSTERIPNPYDPGKN
jgi:hypothetical protein